MHKGGVPAAWSGGAGTVDQKRTGRCVNTQVSVSA